MTFYHIIIAVLIICIVIQFICIWFIYRGRKKTNVPYLPVPSGLLPHIFNELRLNNNSILYDLGCGDSKVLRYCLKQNNTISAIGVELTPLPYFISKVWNIISPLQNLQLIRKNFFNVDITDTTHVFIYLIPEVIKILEPKFRKECKAGTIIVSCNYPLESFELINTCTVSINQKVFNLYTYQI